LKKLRKKQAKGDEDTIKLTVVAISEMTLEKESIIRKVSF
jgi:hypothetical protein